MRTIKVKFATRFNRPDVISAPVGNGERSIFEERLVDGQKKLVVTGKEDFKAFIEASKNETLISNIMKRFNNGDMSVLQRVQGFYGDVTGMPSNLAEAQNMLNIVRNQFEALPKTVKNKFDNSFDKYVSQVSNSSVDDFMNLFGFVGDNAQTDKPHQEVEVVQNDKK